jgi:hypothetical protein
VHGAAAESFVYRVELDGQVPPPGRPMPVEEAIARVSAGERLTIVPPGSDGERVWVV